MNRRFPLNVRIIGLVQNQRQKTYLSSVLWSDRSDVIVYRTFEEFKKLHKTVVKKYPLEAGRIKKSDRVLPKFQDVSLKERRSAGVGKSVMRMRVLEKYCSELLRSTVKISSDQDVSQFFLPTDSDLAPSFPSDSVIILPSATERNTNSWRRPNYAQTITQPVASENYKCVAAYEGKDTENRPFKVLEDEIVDVITKNSSGNNVETQPNIGLFSTNVNHSPRAGSKATISRSRDGCVWVRGSDSGRLVGQSILRQSPRVIERRLMSVRTTLLGC